MKRKNDICVVSFIYPLIEDYLKEFIQSLNKQSYNNFDCIIIDDKYNKSLNNFTGEIIVAPKEMSIIQIRTWIINKLIDCGYKLVIFIDADDIMKENRVKKIIEEYGKTNGKYGFYYNELFLLKEKMDFYRGNLPEEMNHINQILSGNCIGMSHTALNLGLIKNDIIKLKPSSQVIAYDWLLHSFLLLKGYKGKKVNTITYYRIYDNNIAGKVANTPDKILLGIRVKKHHYFELMKYDSIFYSKYNQILKTEDYILKNGVDSYIKKLSNLKEEIFWWRNIKTLDELEEEKNDKNKW